MDIYRIEWKNSALKELKRIDRTIIQKIIDTIQSLATDPRPSGVRKLRGSELSYRIRVADYRIIYEVIDDMLLILIIRVRHRKDVYRD